jgi:hypothetical protein
MSAIALCGHVSPSRASSGRLGRWPTCSITTHTRIGTLEMLDGQKRQQNGARGDADHDHVNQITCRHQYRWWDVARCPPGYRLAALWLISRFLCAHQIPKE